VKHRIWPALAATAVTIALTVGGTGTANAALISTVATTPIATAASAIKLTDAVGIVRDAAACTAMIGGRVDVANDAEAGTNVAARIVSATVSLGDGIATPATCDLSGVVDGSVQFQVQLPLTGWNGRYFQAGCGGFCGAVPISNCVDALKSGFAVAAEDSGHSGNSGVGTWALDSPEAEADWGNRSTHLLALVSKALVEDFYGQTPSYSYFQGCSTGGRQALIEAQRYPDDFDGIVAGAPALYQNYLAVLSQGYLERVNRDENHKVILTAAASKILSAAVLAVCDLDDDRADGVVSDPANCAFDISTVQCADDAVAVNCLTAAQVDVANAFYSPPVNSAGEQLYPAGMPFGTEAGWAGYSIGTDTTLSGGGNYAQEVLRYLAFEDDPGAEYTLYDFDFDSAADVAELEAKARVYNADDVDLSAFENSGGKLILWHGMADPLITALGTVNYFEDVAATDGGQSATDEYARMFLLPGVYHCTGGPGQSTVDWLGSITDWVEGGVAPETVSATTVAAGVVLSQRTVSRYIIAAAGDGDGEEDGDGDGDGTIPGDGTGDGDGTGSGVVPGSDTGTGTTGGTAAGTSTTAGILPTTGTDIALAVALFIAMSTIGAGLVVWHRRRIGGVVTE
jgi:hypothetical protein